MLHQSHFLIILLTFIPLYFLNTVDAAQKESVDVRQNNAESTSGKVTDVITTDSFTYVEVEMGKEKVWVAAPVTTVKKGDKVLFSTMMPMKNYHSKSLGRDFAVLYITKSFTADKNESATSTISATKWVVGVGDSLRDTILDGLDGSTKTFSNFKGKPLIINIWASWCGPCRAEMGSLQRLAQRYNGKEFNIIGISTDDYRDKASAAIKQANITFENFLDHNLELENMLGAKTIPLTILVAADGRVLKKIHGARNWDSPEMIGSIGDVFQTKLKNN